MKTIKQFARDFIRALSITKTNQYETENVESARNPELDNPSVGENPGIAKTSHVTPTGHSGRGSGKVAEAVEASEDNSSPGEKEDEGAAKNETSEKTSSVEEKAEETNEHTEATESQASAEKELEKIEFQAAIQRAFEEGVIEGRNSVIEEKYFPTKDDGIPAFRGNPAPSSPSLSDIFTLAREA